MYTEIKEIECEPTEDFNEFDEDIILVDDFEDEILDINDAEIIEVV